MKSNVPAYVVASSRLRGVKATKAKYVATRLWQGTSNEKFRKGRVSLGQEQRIHDCGCGGDRDGFGLPERRCNQDQFGPRQAFGPLAWQQTRGPASPRHVHRSFVQKRASCLYDERGADH